MSSRAANFRSALLPPTGLPPLGARRIVAAMAPSSVHEAGALLITKKENVMASKNKSGRETRKPKQEQNKRVKGQTPSPVNQAVEATRTKQAQTKR